MFQTKEHGKTPEVDLNEMEMSDLPNKFKLMVIKMPNEVKRALRE